MRIILFVSLFSIILLTESTEVDLNHLKCLVCRATMKEIDAEVLKIHPDKVVNVGNHRMDAQGNTIYKQVPLRQSEVHISEILDNVCEKMNDYVRANKKSNNHLTLINLMSPLGAMNPEISQVDIIQDGDLNKSLPHYCSGIIEEYEDDIISLYVNNEDNKAERLCTYISYICKKYVNEDEDKDENNNNVHVKTDSITEQLKHVDEL